MLSSPVTPVDGGKRVRVSKQSEGEVGGRRVNTEQTKQGKRGGRKEGDGEERRKET